MWLIEYLLKSSDVQTAISICSDTGLAGMYPQPMIESDLV